MVRTGGCVVVSLSLAVALAGAVTSTAQTKLDRLETDEAHQALPALAQILFDALPGDSAIWKRLLSERMLFATEAGDVASKTALLAGLRPFPEGIAGSLRIEEARTEDFGTFAVLSLVAREQQTVYGQKIEVRYRTTQVWRPEDGKWRLVAAQNLVLARDPEPLPMDVRKLADFAGVYELSSERRYRVEQRGNGLFGGGDGELTRLIPVGESVFAEAGSRLGILCIFVRGSDGAVERMVQRRKYADLEWRKVAEGD
jgi:hypothetical protein